MIRELEVVLESSLGVVGSCIVELDTHPVHTNMVDVVWLYGHAFSLYFMKGNDKSLKQTNPHMIIETTECDSDYWNRINEHLGFGRSFIEMTQGDITIGEDEMVIGSVWIDITKVDLFELFKDAMHCHNCELKLFKIH